MWVMLAVAVPALVLLVFLNFWYPRRPPRPLEADRLAGLVAPGALSAGIRHARCADGTLVTWWEFGDPKGKALLGLHGLGHTGLCFEDQDEFFRARQIRCIAPTVVGGLSDPAPNSTIADFARTALSVADHVDIDRFGVFGVSWGTLPALGMAALAPERVSSVALFGACALYKDWVAEKPEMVVGMHPDNARILRTGLRFPALLYPMMHMTGWLSASAMLRRFVDDSLPPAEKAMTEPGHPFHRLFTRAWDECGQRGSYFLALGWLAAISRAPGFSWADLDAEGVPVYIEAGELDNVHTPGMSAFIAEHVKNCSVHTVPGQGRLGCMGDGLEAGIERFLARQQEETSTDRS
jgi:pimeloyl-ACP methyl ester carboxylesterase